MLAELGEHATADEFSKELNILSHAVPAIRRDPQQAKSGDFEAQLAILDTRCFLAIQILEDEKAKYLSNMSILNQELRAKIAVEGNAFDGDWDAIEATDNWPSEEAERLQDLVGNHPYVAKHDGYLKEISAYWKGFAGKEAAQQYQKGWELVAGTLPPQGHNVANTPGHASTQGKLEALSAVTERIHGMINPLLAQHQAAGRIIKGATKLTPFLDKEKLKDRQEDVDNLRNYQTNNRALMDQILKPGNDAQKTFLNDFPDLASVFSHGENTK